MQVDTPGPLLATQTNFCLEQFLRDKTSSKEAFDFKTHSVKVTNKD